MAEKQFSKEYFLRQQERSKIKAQLEDLRRRMPAHSVQPEFIRQLEALEERLAELEEE